MHPVLNRVKSILRSYLTLTRGERRGVTALLVLIALVMAGPYIYGVLFPPKSTDFNELVHKLQAAADSGKLSAKGVLHTDTSNLHYALIVFDPNTVSEEDLKTMGLPGNVATRWVHYRGKGATFKRKEDILKIYGVDTAWYKKVEPYIEIEHTDAHTKSSVIVELNAADTTQLMRLYGIGRKRSEAIVNYRTRLGGFYAKTQLYEIHVLPDSVLAPVWNNITLNTNTISRFNINSVPEDKMRQHPYIGKKMAVIIAAYRAKQPITNTAELLNVPGMDTARLHKLTPYLIF